jgi:antitoxin component YwqK of YwqJK toxin-antitoxin module
LILLFSTFCSFGQNTKTDLLSLEELNKKQLFKVGYNLKFGLVNNALIDSIIHENKINRHKILDSMIKVDSVRFNQIREDVYRISLTQIFSRESLEDEDIWYDETSDNWEKAFQLIKNNFPNLQEIHFNGIMRLFPETLFEIQKLQIIDFNVCSCDNEQLFFSTLPTSFKKLKHLKKIKIEGLAWTFIPNDFYNPENISEIYIGIQNDSEYFPPVPASFYLTDSKSISYNKEYIHYFKDSTDFSNYYGDHFDETHLKSGLTKIKLNSHKFELINKANLTVVKGNVDSGNLPHGTWKVFYPSGKIKEIRHYKHGVESKKWKIYADSGNLTASYKFGRNKITFTHYGKWGLIQNKFWVSRENDTMNYYLDKLFKRSFIKSDWYETSSYQYIYQNKNRIKEIRKEFLFSILIRDSVWIINNTIN